MRALLRAHGILDIVERVRQKPEDAASTAAKAWGREDARAVYVLASSMEAKQGESLLVCGTSKEMWARLSAIHEQRSATSKIMLLQQFHEHKMEANDSVIDHVSKVQNMASHLRCR